MLEIDVERFFAECDAARTEIPDLQNIAIRFDPDEGRCGHAHYYPAPEADTEVLHSYIKDVLCVVAVTRVAPKGRKGGKRGRP